MADHTAHEDSNNKPLLSIVVPVFDEAEVIEFTHKRIVEVLGDSSEFDLEIVYVDDGSKDQSPLLLRNIAEADRRVSVVFFSRNFGHQAAVTAGLRYTAGDVVAIIDADLQDPVELVPELVSKWREGYSVVYGRRRNRKESIHKVLAYSIFYRLLSRMSEIPIPKDSGDFCLLDRSVVNAINQLPEKNRFVRGLRAWYGGRQFGLPYDRPLRAAGTSGYSLKKLMNLAFDGIFNFSVLPLRLVFWLGLGSSILATCGLLFFLAHRIFGFEIFGHSPADVPGFTSMILSIFLVSEVQLLSIGVLGEYLGRVYLEVKNRPAYVVWRVRPSQYAEGAQSEGRIFQLK